MSSGVHQKIDQAILEHKNGNFKKAEIIYQELLSNQPGNQDIYYYLGNLKVSLKDFKKAEKYFRKAINYKPDFFKAYVNLGNTLKELSKLSEAEQVYKKTIDLNPNYSKAYYNLGALQQDQNRFKEAEINFKKAVEIEPNFFQAYLNLGTILRSLKKFEEAEQINRKAINLDPNNAKAHNNLGTILVDLVRLNEAEEFIQKAIKLNPNLSEAHTNLNFVKKRKEIIKIIEKNKSSNLRKDGRSLNPLILKRKVEKEVIKELYKIKTVELDKTIKYDARYGNGRCSRDFNLFENNLILNSFQSDLTKIIEKSLKSKIFILDSFFNILNAGGGTTPHNHINQFDIKSGLVNKKYSLTYYLLVGDQSCNQPGFLNLYEPDKKILPEEGTIVIIPASRNHSAIYNGKLDRVMVGINFYSLV
jgi:tetratricopeptide (TPR) repeat protein